MPQIDSGTFARWLRRYAEIDIDSQYIMWSLTHYWWWRNYGSR